MQDLKELIRGIIVYFITLEARAIVAKYKPNIIAVTGSVGKTSAKDAVYTALSGSYFVRKSEKSFNSDLGVPLTVLGVPNGWSNLLQWFKNLAEGVFLIVITAPYPKWLVVEVGADRPGDISKSLSWLKPRAVVATRFPDVPVHVEFYKSPEDVVTEELAPAAWLTAEGAFVYNAEDTRAMNAAPSEVKKVSYGFTAEAEVRGSRYLVTSKNKMPTGISFDITHGAERTHLNLTGMVGKTHADAILAGVALAVAVGVPLSKATEAFARHETPPGRTRLIKGIAGSVIIDDSYNSSPVANEEALRSLADIPRTGKRIAVLADMLELGSYSVAEHQRIGTLVAASSDFLVTVGVRAKGIALGARSAGMPEEHIIECERGADAVTQLLSLVTTGDVILVKGSQSLRMERVVKSLMAEPETAKDVLVRQDTEWLARP
jgi:UDP-N-acetylmuramyl pentapeptide synthase